MLATDASNSGATLFILLTLFVAATWRTLLRFVIIIAIAALALALTVGAITLVHGLQQIAR